MSPLLSPEGAQLAGHLVVLGGLLLLGTLLLQK